VAARPAEHGSVAVGDPPPAAEGLHLDDGRGRSGAGRTWPSAPIHAARPSATPRSGLLQLRWSSLGRAVATRSSVHLGHVEPFTRSLSRLVRSGRRLHRRLGYDGAC
jgi:hypothetical protein